MEYAMLLSVLAGLATGLGGLAAALLPTIDRKSLGASMGFAAGDRAEGRSGPWPRSLPAQTGWRRLPGL